jgi:hypothetical protein
MHLHLALSESYPILRVVEIVEICGDVAHPQIEFVQSLLPANRAGVEDIAMLLAASEHVPGLT